MPTYNEPNLPDQLPPVLECALRAVLLREGAVIPVTPGEVATYDAGTDAASAHNIEPPCSPSLLFSWERKDRAPKAEGEIIQVGDFESQSFAFAARDGKAVSDETRQKLSQLVRQMKQSD
jgi:hypothetical protein